MRLRRRSVVEERLRSSVVVTLESGQSFSGVLWEWDDRVLVLRDAVAHDIPDQGSVGVDGELLLPSLNVAYLQRP